MPKDSGLLSAAIRGDSDDWIVRETVRRLDEKLAKEGRDTFTFKELWEAKESIFTSKQGIS